MSEPLELKKTLNLPKTDFPMKASLPQNEPKQLAAWQEAKLYERILEVRKDRPLFVLHDGPPYPTGEIHLGTGLNNILKDLVVKTRRMAGHYAPYVPGWDCHGLPIETQVEKELGGKGKVPPAEFRKLCREFATRYVEQHKRDFKRLGIFGRWNDPYLTMSFDYEATIAGAFLDFMESGYVYRGRKPVYWCIHDSTALAEAEVEYEDHTSPSIWVKFGVVGGGSGEAAKIGNDVSAVIWTTTPWTIPHNRALAFHPEFEYVVVDTERGALLLAADRVAALQAESGIKEARIRGKFKSSDFSGMKFQHPFLPIQVPGILADYVTLDQGSGIVHTAPGHGADDFYSGQKYGLEIYAPIDDRGVYLEGLPEYKGKDVFTANPIIVKLLAERGALLGNHEYKHSYPHCWRCRNPVIFRATEQWFIKIDAAAHGRSASLRQEALNEIRHVKWIPAWGEDRMYDMIAERPDWTVSRQRFWGVPIIVFYCDACGSRLEDFVKPCATSCAGSRKKAPTHGTNTPPNSFCRLERNAPAAQLSGARKTTSSTCGLILVPRTSQFSRPKMAWSSRDKTGVPPTSISKALTSIAAGSIARCSSPPASSTKLRSAALSPTAGPSTKKASPCLSPSATRYIPMKSSSAGAPTCFASGWPPSNIKPT